MSNDEFQSHIHTFCSGLIKRKGRYAFLGLSDSGKTSLIKLLSEEQLIYPVGYSNVDCEY